jgi:cytosine/adenosine deaminase-related metal-dependent hydrolase
MSIQDDYKTQWGFVSLAIWISDTDMDLLSRKGAQVSHNGAANLRLGSGIAAVREYIRHGVTVGIGTRQGGTRGFLGEHDLVGGVV